VFLAQVGLLLIGSAGPASAQVTKVDTHVALVSTVNPSVFGQSVMFIATAVPADPLAGTPTGTMQFMVDGANLGGLIVLNGGQAAAGTLSLSVGTHTVSAVYSGDAAFNGSTGSLPGGQTVNKANSRVLLSTSVNPSVFGQQVTFTAVIRPIAPGSGSPQGGMVQFRVDGSGLGASVPVSGGQATKSTTTLAVGSHTVAAVFSGDASFNGSTGTLAAPQVVNKAGTTTSVTSSVNPSVFGQPVTFTATVGPVAPGSPGGSVQFAVDGSNLGGPLVLSAGTASISTSALAVGTHAVTASYGGGANFNGSTGVLAGGQTVNKADSVTSLSSSDNPSTRGQSVTFTATVSPDSPGSGSPTGIIEFTIDGGGAVTVALADRQASFSAAALSAGDHTVRAAYSGDAGFNASSTVLTQTVISADTTTVLTSSTNPSAFHQQITFTAAVAADDAEAGTPGGRVLFQVDGQDAGGSALSGGQATLSIADLAVGDHTVEATYLGDDTFNPSNDSLTQVVTRADTTTALVSSSRPSAFGERVTFTATVRVVAPGDGTPSGTVAFEIDGQDAGSIHLSGGAATISMSDLSVGTHVVRAVYSGTGDFEGSGDSLTQTVDRADTGTQVVSSANPAVLASSVTFTAQVVVNAPGDGTPTGTIQFRVDGADLGPGVPLRGGSASMTASDLPAGTHTIAAVYSGDGNFTGSSDSLHQSIEYATGDCQGVPGRQILPPINAGESVSDVNAGSTVPVKFRVCDANGDAVGTPGVVESFELVKRVGDQGGEEVLHQAWTDGEFKYSYHAWKLNLDTKDLEAGFTYFWSIHLNDGTSIDFRFHLKGRSSTSPGTTKKH